MRNTTNTSQILIACIGFVFINSCQSNRNSDFIFKVSTFDDKGILESFKLDTFTRNATLNLDFYNKNFQIPNYYPKKFTDSRYKDELITEWSDSGKTGNIQTNSTYEYYFDSLSRVKFYNYSSCLYCSRRPFVMKILYNVNNCPIRLMTSFTSFEKKPRFDEEYVLTYNKHKDLVKLVYFQSGVMRKEIKMVN